MKVIMKCCMRARWCAFPGYAARHRLPGTLYAYLAYGGATLSAKDALAQGMLAIAQEKGFLKPGQPVVECSSGTFAGGACHCLQPFGASACGCACRAHWPCAPETAYRAWRKAGLYHGGRTGAAARAQAVAMRTGGYFLNYFDNDINAEFHRRVTGPAIVKATEANWTPLWWAWAPAAPSRGWANM